MNHQQYRGPCSTSRNHNSQIQNGIYITHVKVHDGIYTLMYMIQGPCYKMPGAGMVVISFLNNTFRNISQWQWEVVNLTLPTTVDHFVLHYHI